MSVRKAVLRHKPAEIRVLLECLNTNGPSTLTRESGTTQASARLSHPRNDSELRLGLVSKLGAGCSSKSFPYYWVRHNLE